MLGQDYLRIPFGCRIGSPSTKQLVLHLETLRQLRYHRCRAALKRGVLATDPGRHEAEPMKARMEVSICGQASHWHGCLS